MGNTIKADALFTVLTVASTFAGSDKTLPMLTAVRLDFTESQVTGAGTDRFVLGVQRADYSGEAFSALITTDDVKTIARVAKTATRDRGWREAEIEIQREKSWPAGADYRDPAAAVERADGRVVSVSFRFNSGEAITVQTLDSEFPKYKQLIPADVIAMGDDIATVKGFNASYLAKFAKVPGSYQMKLIVGKDTRPSVVSIGDDFIGLIMPVRLADWNGYARPAWLD